MSDTITTRRSCGGCTTCCKTLGVDALDKKEGEECRYCDTGKGCKIYASRPQICIDYACDWLNGAGTEDERPDKTGIVVTRVGNRTTGGLYQIVESEPGLLASPYGKRLVNKGLALPMVVCYCEKWEPPHLIIPSGAIVHRRVLRFMMNGMPYRNEDRV